MQKQIYPFGICLLAVLALASCSEKPDIEYTSTYKMAGEWYTRYYDGTAPVTAVQKMITFNTADPNSNQIWVDDHSNSTAKFRFKSKVNVDYPNLAFAATNNAPNETVSGRTIKVYEGKVLPGAAHSKSGNVVDSIYLRIEFSNDPGKVYTLQGHQRTGFFEDEY